VFSSVVINVRILSTKIKLMKPESESHKLRDLPDGQKLTLGSVGYEVHYVLLDPEYNSGLIFKSHLSPCVQLDGKYVTFPTDARPKKRAINMHAQWAHKLASSCPTSSSETATLPSSVWSGGSWKSYVDEWLAKS
jgi:hypothetical protein